MNPCENCVHFDVCEIAGLMGNNEYCPDQKKHVFLYSVVAYYHLNGCKKDRFKTALILATSEEQAKQKFIDNVDFPNQPRNKTRIHVSFVENGIYEIGQRRCL